MKKFISILCAVVMIAVISCVGSSAAEPCITFSLVPHAIFEGSTEIVVDVVANVAEGENFTAFGVQIDYDSENLTVKEPPKTNIKGTGMYSEFLTDDPYTWVWVSGTTVVEAGEYITTTITFTINKDGGAAPGDKFEFKLSAHPDAIVKKSIITDKTAVDYDYTADEVAYIGGEASVGSLMLGDLDGNGKCDSNDVIVLLRKLAGWENVTTAPDEAADVDGSGKVDSNDAIYYLRSLAGWADHDIG